MAPGASPRLRARGLVRRLRSSRSTLAGQIATQLAVASVAVLLLATVGAGILASTYADGLIRNQIARGTEGTAIVLRDIESLLIGSVGQLAGSQSLADAVATGDGTRLRADAIAMTVAQGFDFVWIVGPDGTPLANVGGLSGISIDGVVAAARVGLQSTAIEHVGDRHWLVAAALYRSSASPDGTAVVVIGRSIEGARLADLARAEGTVVTFVSPSDATSVSGTGSGGYTYVTRHGAPVGVVVVVPTDQFKDVLPPMLLLIVVVGIIGSVASATFAVRVTRAGLRPFEHLTSAAAAIASGASSEPVPERGPDDVVAVATAFNSMVRSVADRQADLRRAYEASQVAAAAAQHRATHDPLTELPNRVVLRDELERAVGGPPFALLMLDLDDFKDINDTFGHAVGDRVLMLVAERVRGHVAHDVLVARLGGDEFAVLVRRPGARAAIRTARDVLRAFADPLVIQDQNLTVRGTFGIALYPLHGSDPSTLMRHADVAMYQAKVERSGYHLYDAVDDPDPSRRMGLAAELRQALERSELRVVYQPVVHLRSGRIDHAEALLRWHSPTFGEVLPIEFIPLAEHTGTIRALTTFALRTALAQSALWRTEGLPLPVAVNISVRALMRPEFPDTVISLLRDTGAVAEDLICEITEGVVMSDRRRALAVMAAMRETGVRWSLDDFGTGYSSLSLLHDLPLDEIKVDRSFVARLSSDSGSAEVVRAIVQIARAFDVRVTAEGIEDGPTATALTDLGCDLGQGFLYGRPGPASEITHPVASFPFMPKAV